MKDSSKVAVLIAMFDPQDRLAKVNLDTLTEDERSVQYKKADLFFALLLVRLRSHIKKKVDPTLHNNKCLPWAERNLAIVAAYAIIVGHIKGHIGGQDESKCLLRHPGTCNNFLPAANAPLSNFGCFCILILQRRRGLEVEVPPE